MILIVNKLTLWRKSNPVLHGGESDSRGLRNPGGEMQKLAGEMVKMLFLPRRWGSPLNA